MFVSGFFFFCFCQIILFCNSEETLYSLNYVFSLVFLVQCHCDMLASMLLGITVTCFISPQPELGMGTICFHPRLSIRTSAVPVCPSCFLLSFISWRCCNTFHSSISCWYHCDYNVQQCLLMWLWIKTVSFKHPLPFKKITWIEPMTLGFTGHWSLDCRVLLDTVCQPIVNT